MRNTSGNHRSGTAFKPMYKKYTSKKPSAFVKTCKKYKYLSYCQLCETFLVLSLRFNIKRITIFTSFTYLIMHILSCYISTYLINLHHWIKKTCLDYAEHALNSKGQCGVIVIKCENCIKSQTTHNLCKLALESRERPTYPHRHTEHAWTSLQMRSGIQPLCLLLLNLWKSSI